MHLTPNFKLEEFNCHDGTEVPGYLQDNVQLLAENLQVLRDYIGEPIHITSGYRTEDYNSNLRGASPRSQHLQGKAADIAVANMRPRELADIIEELIDRGMMSEGGIGIYSNFTHYDIRGQKARWNMT
ncbi:DUF882 domain-containing protein [Niastella caeni]|uniref:DUF882 domain-containing protein n=1 Tax=Niastella caeni TaxID=2569763 RepID=A0A4S8HVR8_9BACT|nr:D-Ala-D-Ala carboxypeptidase family metallohydrolase [Niastella caeni]THU38144.1 DUF882 domain-containing protein [Niastella caeni]